MSRLNDRQNGLEGRSYLFPFGWSYFVILGHIECPLVGHIGSYCVILDHIGSYWLLFGHIGSSLGHIEFPLVCHIWSYRVILCHFGPYWVILGPLWSHLVLFGSSLVIVGHFGHIWSY